MSGADEFRARKIAECANLRKQAVIGKAVAQSLHSLAPAVAQELQSLIQLKSQNGVLAREWDSLLANAPSVPVGEDEPSAPDVGSALRAILGQLAQEAGRRIVEHGDQLLAKSGELAGRAGGIEATLKELDELEAAPVKANGAPSDDAVHP